MRWRFIDDQDHAEALLRVELRRKMTLWWKAFAERAADIDAHFTKGKEFDLPAWMAEHLQSINDQLCWEFGPGLKGGHRLVITPEAERHLRPLVQVLLAAAPKVKGWEFYPYRLGENVATAEAVVKARSGGSLAGVEVTAATGEDNRIDLCFYSPRCSGPEDQQSRSDAFVATETLLGEELLDNWIGAIDVAPMPPEKSKVAEPRIPLAGLHEAIVKSMAGALSALPSDPRYLMDRSALQGYLFKIKPEKREDYASRYDLYVCQSTFPEMWQAAHSNGIFSSRRFSRCGETFCYLKLDGSEGLDEEKFPDRSSIEDALSAKLGPAEVGGLVGGGTGLRYSYIDFALTDVPSAIPIIRNTLRAGNICKRSWLLFFDSELRSEWIGMWDDTPPPPGLKS